MKVLVAHDFSECSLLALDSLRHQTWPDGTEFRIIYAVEPIYVSYGMTGAYVQPMLNAHLEFMKNYRQIIDERVAEMQSNFPACKVSGTVIEGSPAATILDEAAEWQADLIVMGSHGRTGVQRFLMGSVAQRVASHAPCSVSIVKQKKQADSSGAKKASGAVSV